MFFSSYHLSGPQSFRYLGHYCNNYDKWVRLNMTHDTGGGIKLTKNTRAHTYTHPFNGRLSVTARLSWYQKGKTSLDFTEARDSEWQWHQLGHMQVCTSLQTDNNAITSLLSFFTGQMPFLLPNQQCQSTEGKN